MKVHAYGAGVQSRTLVQKYLHGEFERPDLVIFADTMAERGVIYRAVEEDRRLCSEAGIELVVVSHGNLSEAPGRYVPLFTLDGLGGRGMFRRQCSSVFKIRPIRKELKRRRIMRAEIWLGISTDEIFRVRESDVAWLRNRYPLIEMGMSREDCKRYMKELGVRVARSACVFCPYHSKRDWLELEGDDLKKAVLYDESVRHLARGLLFVHSDRVPLVDAVAGAKGSDLNLFNNECEGYCGV